MTVGIVDGTPVQLYWVEAKKWLVQAGNTGVLWSTAAAPLPLIVNKLRAPVGTPVRFGDSVRLSTGNGFFLNFSDNSNTVTFPSFELVRNEADSTPFLITDVADQQNSSAGGKYGKGLCPSTLFRFYMTDERRQPANFKTLPSFVFVPNVLYECVAARCRETADDHGPFYCTYTSDQQTDTCNCIDSVGHPQLSTLDECKLLCKETTSRKNDIIAGAAGTQNSAHSTPLGRDITRMVVVIASVAAVIVVFIFVIRLLSKR